MQFRLIPAFLIFLGSYLPLAVILAVQDIAKESWDRGICTDFRACGLPELNNPVLSLTIVALTVSCLVLTAAILINLRYKYPVKVMSAKRIPNELISYSFPYIVSFMGVDYGALSKLAGFIIFMLWLFTITYRAGQIVLNPILSILGWSLYEAEVLINGNERVVRLLSRAPITPGLYYCQEIQGSYINKDEKRE